MTAAPQIVCVASTMRSGSTLLKALLAEASDVSNLPEQNFQKFVSDAQAADKIAALDDNPIIVLKRPGWYNEIGSYPRLPNITGLKTIVLIRDCYDTVQSLRKMTFRKLAGWVSGMTNGWLAKKYWAGMTESLLKLHNDDACDSLLVRYEDLTARPLEETLRMFDFIGSSQKTGVDSYSKPDDFRWRWGSDDNSDNIKSLTVQARPAKPQTNQSLVELINSNERIKRLREQAGYL